MRIALTGVSGFIGSVLARHLSEAGHQVTGLVRQASRRDHIEPWVDCWVTGDQADEACWPALLDGADCLIHNSLDWESLKDPIDFDRHIHSNLTGAIRLLHASAPRQFIFLSTIAVHHDMKPRWDGQIDEDHPLRPATLYGACKAAVEAHLWAAHYSEGRHTSAFRPCAVYGMDPRLERSIGYPIIRRIARGRPFGRAGGGKFIHVDDVALSILATLDNPEASGCVYNLADCYARWSDVAKMCAELLGVEAEIDDSSPTQPKNVFTKDAAMSLGVPLDRGHEGIRTHVAELIEAMRKAGVLEGGPPSV